MTLKGTPSIVTPTGDDDAVELVADEGTRELVVVAGNEDHPRALADLAQQLLDDVVVGLRPVPVALELPAVDDVADQEQVLALDVTAGSRCIGSKPRTPMCRRRGEAMTPT